MRRRPPEVPVKVVATADVAAAPVEEDTLTGAGLALDEATPIAPPERAAQPAGDEVSDIFSRLRGEPPTSPENPPTSAENPPTEAVAELPAKRPKTTAPVSLLDPFELRQRLLLPVSNRALRNIKRQLTEIQNDALEELRVSGGTWEPNHPGWRSRSGPTSWSLLAESFSMGHARPKR